MGLQLSKLFSSKAKQQISRCIVRNCNQKATRFVSNNNDASSGERPLICAYHSNLITKEMFRLAIRSVNSPQSKREDMAEFRRAVRRVLQGEIINGEIGPDDD